jgi:hypothetical protein
LISAQQRRFDQRVVLKKWRGSEARPIKPALVSYVDLEGADQI